ncbi:MAG: hypothetical protein KatS3mg082_3131 [Nitrospiraceae bacterium]|nr:MAG: hypothetical protein KatS3mg082_3131 [Nitrospiraceae bacterium]
MLEYAPDAGRDRNASVGVGHRRARSKGQAVARSIGLGRKADLILVWHLGLLKLLPFLSARRAPVVLFLHGVEAWRPTGWIGRKLLDAVDLFLANSRHTWERFVACNPRCRGRPFRVVPLGIGNPCGAPVRRDREAAALVLGRMARTEDYKGHRELLEAWPHIMARIPEAQLWIAGDGDLRPELERLARKRGVQDRVTFFGFVTDEEKAELLSRCRCLAMPSRGEGFGLVYLEAMRVGTPCLVSTLDAGREVVNPPEAGLAVDPSDSRGLADAVCRLLMPGPDWERWSRRARERYERQYTAAHFQQRLLEALDELWSTCATARPGTPRS